MFNIYWNKYEFESNNKYLIYFFGNLSPPHKGHLYLMQKFFNVKNINILVHIFGDESRHGYSEDTSLKILNIYVKNINNITIKKFDSTYLNINLKNIDKVVIIRGNEDKKNIKNYIIQLHGNLIKMLRKKGILTDVLLMDRLPNISSTELCNNMNNIEYYLPSFLSENDKLEILKLFFRN